MDVKWAFHPWLFAWAAGLFAVGMGFGYLTGLQHNASSVAAIIGALTACCGIITLGRPMIRRGGYNAWAESQRNIDLGSVVPTEEERQERLQEDYDACAVQIVGPVLAILGTMLNGISGLFS